MAQGPRRSVPHDDLPLRLPPVDPTAAPWPGVGLTLPPELIASRLADGDDQTVVWSLRAAIAEVGRAAAYDRLIATAMMLVGARWDGADRGIAEEHLASQTIVRALDAVRPSGGDGTGPTAVLAGVAGERHSIGLICLAHLLEERGWNTINLGPDMPASEIARFVASQEASLLGLSASLDERHDAVVATVAAVRGATRSGRRATAIILGGRLGARHGYAGELGIDWAGASLVGAESAITGLVTPRTTRRR